MGSGVVSDSLACVSDSLIACVSDSLTKARAHTKLDTMTLSSLRSSRHAHLCIAEAKGYTFLILLVLLLVLLRNDTSYLVFLTRPHEWIGRIAI